MDKVNGGEKPTPENPIEVSPKMIINLMHNEYMTKTEVKNYLQLSRKDMDTIMQHPDLVGVTHKKKPVHSFKWAEGCEPVVEEKEESALDKFANEEAKEALGIEAPKVEEGTEGDLEVADKIVAETEEPVSKTNAERSKESLKIIQKKQADKADKIANKKEKEQSAEGDDTKEEVEPVKESAEPKTSDTAEDMEW